MNKKDLNIEYICEKTLLAKDDELVPIILDLIQESYKAGLCQAEYDNTMGLIEENQELKQINEEHKKLNGELRVENQELKDNWNKIKGIIKDMIYVGYVDKNRTHYWATRRNSEFGVRADVILNKMQELEQGSDSNDRNQL